ncbi:MAG: hypothetical protein AAFX94_16850 [Myxococcota bacterium]
MKRSVQALVLDSAVQGGALYAAFQMFRFGRDKVLGINSSVEGFQQIGAGFGVDPDAFRLFVGTQELLVAGALAAAALVFLRAAQSIARPALQIGVVGLGATMVGALVTEFYVRPGEQNWLVYLALRLIVIGAVVGFWSVKRFGIPLPLRALLRRNTGQAVAIA